MSCKCNFISKSALGEMQSEPDSLKKIKNPNKYSPNKTTIKNTKGQHLGSFFLLRFTLCIIYGYRLGYTLQILYFSPETALSNWVLWGSIFNTESF